MLGNLLIIVGGGNSSHFIPRIEIATNATIHLKQEVLDCLKRNPKILVRISNYDVAQIPRTKFIKQLQLNGIEYKMYSFRYGNDTWFSTGGANEARADNVTTKAIYEKCENKGCLSLVDGNLSVCGKIASIKELYSCYDTYPYDEVWIRKLRAAKIFTTIRCRYSIYKFFQYFDRYKQQCRYCKIASGRFPAGEQMSAGEIRENLSNK